MPLLNYTTQVPATRTVNEIHEILVKAGAHSILSQYDDGKPAGVAFVLRTTFGLRHYALPVNVAAVEKVMTRYRSGVPPRFKNAAQAERVAWRILKDWLEAQIAIISTEQVALEQVLLPYMLVDKEGTTVFDQYRDDQLQLGPGS